MYYPKSQITPNLYTNGNEFVYEDSGLFYNGYYFKTSKGEYFTGRNQDDRLTKIKVSCSAQKNNFLLFQ